MTASDLPEDILEAVSVIQELGNKTYRSRAESDNLNRAKLRVAFWACRSENVVASRENLAYILGADAREIIGAYDRYLERDEENKAREEREAVKGRPAGPKKDVGKFWNNR